MITKNRLKELIIQNATIYGNDFGKIELIPDNDILIYENGNNGYILYVLEPNKKYHNEIFDEDLFETEEEAKWFAEFGCIERTERLELPTWEELFEEDRVLDCYTQEFGIVKNRSFIGVVLLGVDFTNEIVEVSIGSDQIFCELLTKENYTLACRKAKELFLGEKK